ncbi:MAG TPA: hypothetical protein VI389_11675 [Geobacteraceae bacterium]
MKRFPRFHMALILTAVYTLVVMSPLAPLAMRSPAIAHAVTGECAGDCAVCGCSPEQSANRTCCCWRKKLQHEHEHEHEHAHKVSDCCKHEEHGKPVLKCGCPCGDAKQLGLWGVKVEQLPYRFTQKNLVFCVDTAFPLRNERLTDRHGDPPDPPPKLAILS